MGSLQAYEERFKKRREESLDQVLNSKASSKENGRKISQKGCGHGCGRGCGRGNSQGKGMRGGRRGGRGDHDNFDNNERNHHGRGRGIVIFLESVEPMLKKRPIVLVTKKKVKGNVSFDNSSKDGSHKFIKDVHYVSKLKSNILILEQLVEKGYEILMKENYLWLKDQNSNLVAKVFMSRNRMFTLSIKTNEAKCLKVSIKHEAWC
ncbi:hypothetical protein CR513_17022, partial [Mucuna pruriens]